MGALFLNPGFLFIAAALISVPIIIHLINRMRFKRIRWAAMEFLLKAQKRTRRRLIIEQLILLALRCLLIALVGLLVSRFIGCGDSNLTGKPNLHIAIIDDTPSMQDQWDEGGVKKNCFEVAKNDILIKKITTGLSKSKTNDRLMILPLSQLSDPEFKAEIFERLNDPEKLKACNTYITELQPSMVHVPMLQGVKKAQAEMGKYPESQITLHVLSDFRHSDWSAAKAEALYKELGGVAQAQKGIKIHIIDTVDPPRAKALGGFPSSRDNVGIVDIRPSTRIIGAGMPVQFSVAIKNFSGKQVDVTLEARNETTGKDMLDVNFSPQNPVKLMPSAVTTVTFEQRFNPDKDNPFAYVSVRLVDPLKRPLGNDGLLVDNTRYAVVEVRDKVPILVIDGAGKNERERRDAISEGDSFFISRSLMSVPGSSFQVVYGDDLSPGTPTKVLERADLNKYPTIFMLNVQNLTPKQTANLENYVRDGGGVAFYMGPLVDGDWYNKNLFKQGKGVFPAPLQKFPFPPLTEKELESKGTDTYQLIIREEKFASVAQTPIFGAMFGDPKNKMPLRDLPIRRYFKVADNQWKPEAGRVFELATLPNDALANTFDKEVVALYLNPGVNYKAIMDNKDLAKYQPILEAHMKKLAVIANPGSPARAYHLANAIDFMFVDKGGGANPVSMPEFWANPNENVQALRVELNNLRDRVNYGDPFVITQTFGKGKVVAVLSTAGKDWNDWGGGSLSQVLYPMFIWELQNYLSSQGSEANLSVGTDIDFRVDMEQFRNAKLKLVRDFLKPVETGSYKKVRVGEPEPTEQDGQLHYKLTKNIEPGAYISKLVDENDKDLVVMAHSFNVDTAREGDLTRVGNDELTTFVAQFPGVVDTQGVDTDSLVARVSDFSESPWLFLMFLFVLVAEQALAVHLSFHMKAGDDQLAPAGSGGRQAKV